jgi:hypothetical protein
MRIEILRHAGTDTLAMKWSVRDDEMPCGGRRAWEWGLGAQGGEGTCLKNPTF